MLNPLHLIVNDENWNDERKQALKKLLSDDTFREVLRPSTSPIEEIQEQLAAGQCAIKTLVQAGYTYNGNGLWEKPKPNLIECMSLDQKLNAIKSLSSTLEATKGGNLNIDIRKKLEMLVESI